MPADALPGAGQAGQGGRGAELHSHRYAASDEDASPGSDEDDEAEEDISRAFDMVRLIWRPRLLFLHQTPSGRHRLLVLQLGAARRCTHCVGHHGGRVGAGWTHHCGTSPASDELGSISILSYNRPGWADHTLTRIVYLAEQLPAPRRVSMGALGATPVAKFPETSKP